MNPRTAMGFKEPSQISGMCEDFPPLHSYANALGTMMLSTDEGEQGLHWIRHAYG